MSEPVEPTRERADVLEKRKHTIALELETLRGERERLRKRVRKLQKKLARAEQQSPLVQPGNRERAMGCGKFLLALLAVPVGVVIGGIAGLCASAFVLIPTFPHGDWALPLTAILTGVFGLMGGVLALMKIEK